MNQLKCEKQKMVLSLLVEGNSIRGIERITGSHRDTITRLMISVSEACRYDMYNRFRNLKCNYIEVDEIWTYVAKKQKRLTEAELNNGCQKGDQYVFVALDRETKLVPAFYIGKRNNLSTYSFIAELSKRINGRFQLTTDMYRPYIDAVIWTFGRSVNYAMLRKLYHGDGSGREGYSPSRLRGTDTSIIVGDPKPEKICTSYIERQNLTIRTQLRRFTRLTNAFSKTVENLKAAIALHFWHYNFMRIHSTLKMTPAMAAGIKNNIAIWDEVL
ncbi:MAG: IS1 family transposase [candidate division Zixibacteria bacterium]